MRLYYYTGPDHLRDILQKKRVKVSRFGKYGTLNDPFELAAHDLSDQKLRRLHTQHIDKFVQSIGLICMSETRKSPAMWAHYTDNHKGACLEFDVPSDDFTQVKYSTKKVFKGTTAENFGSKINPADIKKIFDIKSEDWAYEKERRMLVSLQVSNVVKEEENYFMPFNNKNSFIILKSVFVGYKFELGISNILDDVSDCIPQSNVFQTRPGFSKFKVVRQRDKRFWNMEPKGKDVLPAERAVYGR